MADMMYVPNKHKYTISVKWIGSLINMYKINVSIFIIIWVVLSILM